MIKTDGKLDQDRWCIIPHLAARRWLLSRCYWNPLPTLLAIASGNNIGLHGIIGGIGGVASHDGSLVERTQAPGWRWRRSSHPHCPERWHPVASSGCTKGQRPDVQRGQPSRLRIPALERHLGRAVVLEHGSDVSVGESTLVGVPGVASAREHSPFEVGLHPRAGSGASAEPAAGAKVDGIHRASRVGFAVSFAVAVVEAADAVDVRAAGHHVNALRRAAFRHARQGPIVPVAVADIEVERVDLFTSHSE